jgi:hypothetical protein
VCHPEECDPPPFPPQALVAGSGFTVPGSGVRVGVVPGGVRSAAVPSVCDVDGAGFDVPGVASIDCSGGEEFSCASSDPLSANIMANPASDARFMGISPSG